jgi:type II secretory pathway predicted ATPase ExeA
MPYLAHFGLREHPFFLSPTTEHFFPTTESLQLLQLLEQAILGNGGLIKLVGPLSSGKTLTAHLLAQRLMQRNGASAEVAVVTAPKTQGAARILAVCKAFGLPTNDPARKPLDLLGTFLVEQKEAGRPCVLVIDDAQTMGLAGLETAQLLSELENDQGRLIHVVLVGQSSLDAMLAAKPMQKVRQAIAFSFSTTPFTAAESRDFIERRIAASREAGATRDVFDAKALDLIVQVTAGIPGSIIILCDKAMRIAQAQDYRTVMRNHVQAATLDCPALAPIVPQRSHHGSWAWVAGIGGCVIGAAVAGTVLMSPTTRDTLRVWAGMAPIEQVQAQAAPAEPAPAAEATAEGHPTETPPTETPAPESAKEPAPTAAQMEQMETEKVPAPEDAAPAKAAAAADHDGQQAAPSASEVEQELEQSPVSVVAKPSAPEKPPVTPEAAKPVPPQKPAPVVKPAPAKPEPPKPEPVKPAPPKPEPPKPAPAKPEPVKPTPAKPAVEAPAKPEPAPTKPAPVQTPPKASASKPAASGTDTHYKAKVGPNGELIWD